MVARDEEIALAVSITGTFENSGDPFTGLSGDADGMGLSCGVLQWNIGSNSLQPLVRLVGHDVVLQGMPTHGEELWSACNSPPDEGSAIVRGWQTNGALHPIVVGELRALMGSPEMRSAQLRRIEIVAQKADALAEKWAHDCGRTQRTRQEFVWFFDVLTQNGGMRGIWRDQYRVFVAAQGERGATDEICDWLENSSSTWWGHKDCVKNAALWRDTDPARHFELFVLSYLRASIASQTRARGVVMNRKGAIANKKGYVNGTYFEFSSRT
ncbi:MAG: peptidoglycan-binding domain 1 protein [Bradyrhizobium sp.]|nr:MAG: peptidoglycan-binding domain 1 protein [Bradyrhizobium sp.]